MVRSRFSVNCRPTSLPLYAAGAAQSFPGAGVDFLNTELLEAIGALSQDVTLFTEGEMLPQQQARRGVSSAGPLSPEEIVWLKAARAELPSRLAKAE